MLKYQDANKKNIAAHIVYAKPYGDNNSNAFALYEDEAGNIPASGAKLTESFLNNTLLFRVWPEGASGYQGYVKPSLMSNGGNFDAVTFGMITQDDNGLKMAVCLCLAE